MFRCTSPHSMCTREVSRKTDILRSTCKKIKKISCNKSFFSIEICLFYTGHIASRFFVKRLCAEVEREDVHADFLFGIFWHFKMRRKSILKYRVHMHPGAKTPSPLFGINHLNIFWYVHFLPSGESVAGRSVFPLAPTGVFTMNR